MINSRDINFQVIFIIHIYPGADLEKVFEALGADLKKVFEALGS